MDIKYFNYTETEEIAQHTKLRKGEMKLGQLIQSSADLETSTAKFVVLGIAESIGVKGNHGIAGTHTAWESFIEKFLNLQQTDKLDGAQIILLGHFNFQALYESCTSIDDFRNATKVVDEAVYPLIQEIVAAGRIPIIIGGSHANAYPIIKGTSLALDQAIASINLDAHADFRPLEGRHSGNPFSYAYDEKFLAKYAVIGLHENYNSQSMLNAMAKRELTFISWEDIYLRKAITFSAAISQQLAAFGAIPCGVELDLDAISNTLSSAMGPSGFSLTEARQYAHETAKHERPTYLHLCEGSARLENGQTSLSTGKLLSYLATDFIKSYLETSH